MTFFKFMLIVSSISAGLCVLGVPLWILGVPGTENEYAKGWKMGLNVILIYPALWLLNYAPYFVMRHRIGEAGHLRWEIITGCIALFISLLAAGRMLHAFRTML